jgi:hypothetical protein
MQVGDGLSLGKKREDVPKRSGTAWARIGGKKAVYEKSLFGKVIKGC